MDRFTFFFFTSLSQNKTDMPVHFLVSFPPVLTGYKQTSISGDVDV